MDELLPEEITAIRDSVIRFMETEVNPVMNEIEKSGVFPRDLVKKAGAAGFYGAVFPESVGIALPPARHLHAPNSLAMSLFWPPSPASSTIRARCARGTLVRRERINARNF